MAEVKLSHDPAPVLKPALRIAGLGDNFKPATIGNIPRLWDRLASLLPLPGQQGRESYGVARSGLDGRDMHYLAGVAVSADALLPADFQTLELSARPYLVFRQELDGSALHPQMRAAAQVIWGRLVPASGRQLTHAPELEVYPEGFRPDLAGAWVEWWIPVEL